jgi:hypothetical protein
MGKRPGRRPAHAQSPGGGRCRTHRGEVGEAVPRASCPPLAGAREETQGRLRGSLRAVERSSSEEAHSALTASTSANPARDKSRPSGRNHGRVLAMEWKQSSVLCPVVSPGHGMRGRMYAGAQFEILIDGRTRSWRDVLEVALDGARYLKELNPGSEVAVRDTRNATIITIHQPSNLEAKTWQSSQKR